MEVSDFDSLLYDTWINHSDTVVSYRSSILYDVHSLTFHFLTPREDIYLTLFSWHFRCETFTSIVWSIDNPTYKWRFPHRKMNDADDLTWKLSQGSHVKEIK